MAFAFRGIVQGICCDFCGRFDADEGGSWQGPFAETMDRRLTEGWDWFTDRKRHGPTYHVCPGCQRGAPHDYQNLRRAMKP